MRRIVGMVGALFLSLVLAGNSLAVGALITPHTQSHSHGASSHWTLTWSGTSPFDAYFWYDTNQGPGWWITNTSTTSKSLSHAYYPCTRTTFHQELDVYDTFGLAADTSTATEEGGSCNPTP